MDIIEKLVVEVFENSQDYSDLDYLTIMNILKESYMRLNGDIPNETKDLEDAEQIEDDDFDEEDLYYYNLSYTNYENDEEGYLGNYIEPY